MRFSLLAAFAPFFLQVALATASPSPLPAGSGPIGPWRSPSSPFTPSSSDPAVPALDILPEKSLALRTPLDGEVEGMGDVHRRQAAEGEMMMVRVSTTTQQTSIGNITTQCLTLVSDPSQTFCRTLLDGKPLGGDGPPAPAAPTSATPGVAAAVISTPGTSPTTASIADAPTSSAPTTPSSAQLSTSALEALTTSASSSSAELEITTSLGTGGSASSAVSTTAPTAPSSQNTSLPAPESTAVPILEPSTGSSDPAPVPAETLASAEPVSAVNSDSGESSTTVSLVETITIDAQPTSSVSSASVAAPTISAVLAGATAGERSNESDDYPGQKLSVLPIGLGVFGGLVGVALCIVGYMLYQRRLYRGQFVRRKAEEKALASNGAGMGVGGYGGA